MAEAGLGGRARNLTTLPGSLQIGRALRSSRSSRIGELPCLHLLSLCGGEFAAQAGQGLGSALGIGDELLALAVGERRVGAGGRRGGGALPSLAQLRRQLGDDDLSGAGRSQPLGRRVQGRGKVVPRGRQFLVPPDPLVDIADGGTATVGFDLGDRQPVDRRLPLLRRAPGRGEVTQELGLDAVDQQRIRAGGRRGVTGGRIKGPG